MEGILTCLTANVIGFGSKANQHYGSTMSKTVLTAKK